MTINIDWPFFLGILGVIVLVAYHASGRFTALETSMDWVKDILNDLKVSVDNVNIQVFGNKSPINLTEVGEAWLRESGFKEYLDANKSVLMKGCEEKKGMNPYEVQRHVFKMFEDLRLDPAFEDRLKKFAFEKGSNMSTVRRVGAIYFRNLCLSEFGMQTEDIDKHDPKKKTEKNKA